MSDRNTDIKIKSDLPSSSVTINPPSLGKGQSLKTLEEKVKRKYESFWLYPESHPWRLAQHITLRGVFAGGTIGFLGGFPYALIKKREVLKTVGKSALRGSVVGGAIMAAVSAERLLNLPADGVSDRAYRLSYNWGQTKWDLLALDGSILTPILLRRHLGGVLPAAAVGCALGTLTCMFGMVAQKLFSETVNG